MTNSEAIETLRANYPDPCFELLREAVDTAIYALSAQPDLQQTCNKLATDCISRKAAIDALIDYFSFINPIAFIDILSALPPAEPDERMLHESCTDCPLYDHERHSCPRFNKVIPETLREAMTERRQDVRQ